MSNSQKEQNQPSRRIASEFSHLPVLLETVLESLEIKPGKTYVDATAGAGGHLLAIAARAGSTSRIIALDRDKDSLESLRQKVPENVICIHCDYKDIKAKLLELGISTIDGGILADCGVSSMQLDNPERGFSFNKNGPLDMRMDKSQELTAEHLINNLSEEELADIIFRYGEDRRSRQIARAIIRKRPVYTTFELAAIVSGALYKLQNSHTSSHSRSKNQPYGATAKHPATRTFQALRLAVNQELTSLEIFLSDSLSLLSPGARLALISFHSLEDRMVKQFFKKKAASCICPDRYPVCTCETSPELKIITRKPLVADKEEILANTRARSAKLRVGEKITTL